MPLNNDQRANVTVDGKPSFTVDQAAAQLDRADDWWSGALGTAATVTYAYRADAPSMMPDGTGGFTRLTSAQITGAELSFEAWSDVANITFQRVGSGTSGDGAYSDNATILVGNYATGEAGAAAFTFFPGSTAASSLDGDVFVSSADPDNANPVQGSYGLETLTHELGHAIGLSHPSDYEAGDDASTDPTYAANASYYEDSREYSIMSYFASSNTGGSASIFAAAPQLDDIAAAQRLYGANYSTRADDTTYGFNSNTNRPWYSLASPTDHFYAAIWDGGGNDTLDFSGYSQPQLIDLREGNFSNVGGDTGNLAIAVGAKIENAIGGSGDDTLIGNDLNNVLTGNAGVNALTGGAGADTFVEHAPGSPLFGHDTITDFQTGQDILDLTLAAGGGPVEIEEGYGQDYVAFGPNYQGIVTILDGAVSQTAILIQPGDINTGVALQGFTIIGNSMGETLTGGPGPDVINGGVGNDVIYGGDGDDVITGENGNDIIYGDGGNDTITGGVGGRIVIDGGAGVNTAVFAGFVHDYALSLNTAAGTVAHHADGAVSTLTSIQDVNFLDGTLTFDLQSSAAEIVRLYDAFLGRAPDVAGFDSYLDYVAAGHTLADIAANAFASPEFQSHTAGLDDMHYVTYVYETALHRAPDPGGLQTYVADLQNGTFTRTSLILQAAESLEHVALTAATVDAGLWVPNEKVEGLELLYDAAVQRQPDATGLTDYSAELSAGTTFRQIANQMSQSAEFMAAHGAQTDAQYIQSLYAAELGRAADPSGLSAYEAQLQSGYTRGDLLFETAMSQEHQSHVLTFYDPLLG